MFMTWIESRWLKEPTLSYLMTKMTANNKWIPFMHKITKRQCDLNINFGDLALKLPFVTQAFGYYGKIPFEFSETTVSYLLNEMKMWSSELNNKGKEQKHTLILSEDCIKAVPLNNIVSFVHSYPEDVFEIDYHFQW